MKETQQNNNDIRNDKYNFDELKQYLNMYARVFAGPEKEKIEGVEIKNYSNEAKKVWSKMQDVQSKIQKITEKKRKELKEATKEMIKAKQEALRAYRKQNPRGTEGMEYVKGDKNVQDCQTKVNNIQQEIDDVTTKVKREFMDWEQKNIKGNIIARNNNIMTLAKESKAMLGYKGLDIEHANELNNVKLKGNHQQSLSGNLADIATSMIQLLTDKANTTKDQGERNKLEEMVDKIITAVQKFFGFSANDGETIQAHKRDVENLLKQAVKECLNGNLKEIEKSIKNDKSMAQDKINKPTTNKYNNKTERDDISNSQTNSRSQADTSTTISSKDNVSTTISSINNVSTTISSINNGNNKKGNIISNSQTSSINNSSLQSSGNNTITTLDSSTVNVNFKKLLDKKNNDINNNVQNESHDYQMKTAIVNAKQNGATKDIFAKQSISNFSYTMGSNNNLSHSASSSGTNNNQKNNNQNVDTSEDNINDTSNIDQDTTYDFKDDDSIEAFLNLDNDDGPEIGYIKHFDYNENDKKTVIDDINKNINNNNINKNKQPNLNDKSKNKPKNINISINKQSEQNNANTTIKAPIVNSGIKKESSIQK